MWKVLVLIGLGGLLEVLAGPPDLPGVQLAIGPLAGALIPAGIGVLGSIIGAKGQSDAAKRQENVSRLASNRAENARQEAVTAMGDPRTYQLAQFLFPGLLPPPGAAPGFTTPLAFSDPAFWDPSRNIGPGISDPGSLPIGGGGGNRGDLVRDVEPRAMGGPVSPGQPYMVGEQGPELMVPDNSGQIVPLPPTQTGAERQTEGTPEATPAPVPGFGAPGGTPTPALPGILGQTPAPTQPTLAEGASVVQPDAARTPFAGELAVAHILDFLMNPGRLLPIQYQREQEQAEQGLRGAQQAVTGSLSGMGWDPNSGMGQSLMQSAAMNAANQRNEAMRDLALTQEGLYRQDVNSSINNLLNLLNTVFGQQRAQATAAGGQAFPAANIPLVNTNQPIATGLTTFGTLLADYFKNQQNSAGGGGDVQQQSNPLLSLVGGFGGMSGGQR